MGEVIPLIRKLRRQYRQWKNLSYEVQSEVFEAPLPSPDLTIRDPSMHQQVAEYYDLALIFT